MAVPTVVTDLSVTAASNSPAGADAVAAGTGPDDYLRALSAIVRREQAQATAVASATTVDLGAITTGNYVHITGTTAITGFGTVAAGIERTVVFDGALTLTHNATSLILPGGANIATAAGDCAVFRSEGSGNWRCIAYDKASGIPVDAKLTTLAGLAVTDGNFVVGNGTTWVAESGATARTSLGLGTVATLDTGTGSGNVPLVGTASATDALAGLIELATSAEAQALADTGRAITPSTLNSAYQGSNQSLGASGYQKLPGGLVIQWGSTTSSGTASNNAAITFPSAFGTACYAAYAVVSGSSGGPITVLTGTINTTTANFTTISGSTIVSSVGIYWFALGS